MKRNDEKRPGRASSFRPNINTHNPQDSRLRIPTNHKMSQQKKEQTYKSDDSLDDQILEEVMRKSLEDSQSTLEKNKKTKAKRVATKKRQRSDSDDDFLPSDSDDVVEISAPVSTETKTIRRLRPRKKQKTAEKKKDEFIDVDEVVSEERRGFQLLRQEQDLEYMDSLREDKLKEEKVKQKYCEQKLKLEHMKMTLQKLEQEILKQNSFLDQQVKKYNLMIRMTDGSSISKIFGDVKWKYVRNWVEFERLKSEIKEFEKIWAQEQEEEKNSEGEKETLREEKWDKFDLVTDFPRKVYNENEKTLSQLGLMARETVRVLEP